MKILALGLVLVLAIGVAAALFLVRTPARTRVPAPIAATADPVDAEDRAALLARVERLERELDGVRIELGQARLELDGLRSERRVLEPEPAPGDAPRPVTSGDPRTPSWYLEQYVASFAQGGEGSEYFRLAVEAFAPSLVREIGALVLDSRSNPLLRLNLVHVLGDPRLRGGAAADLLLRMLPLREADQLVGTAIEALARVGDARTALALEGLVFSVDSADNRWSAMRVLISLAGPGANDALLRLWRLARGDDDRAVLIALVQPGEAAPVLEFFELASRASQPVRLQAAGAVGELGMPALVPFVDAWAERETDAQVRAVLRSAHGVMTRPPDWSAARAAGPPDAQAARDDPDAWATAQPDMGLQWLELVYDPPRRASGLRIFEVCVSGAIASAVAFDEGGGRHELWSGNDPTETPGVFAVEFRATSFRVARVRLTLDTDRRPGWSEIDAVELVGPEGGAWATGATASSSYGERGVRR